MSKFSFCFPGDNGKMICQHHNGRWIVFPIYWENDKKDKALKKKAESKTIEE